jgi:hypothetical protein
VAELRPRRELGLELLSLPGAAAQGRGEILRARDRRERPERREPAVVEIGVPARRGQRVERLSGREQVRRVVELHELGFEQPNRLVVAERGHHVEPARHHAKLLFSLEEDRVEHHLREHVAVEHEALTEDLKGLRRRHRPGIVFRRSDHLRKNALRADRRELAPQLRDQSVVGESRTEATPAFSRAPVMSSSFTSSARPTMKSTMARSHSSALVPPLSFRTSVRSAALRASRVGSISSEAPSCG